MTAAYASRISTSALYPLKVRESTPDADIALFWHIPFPSVETFSCIPWRKELLQGPAWPLTLWGSIPRPLVNNFLNTVKREVPEATVAGWRWSWTVTYVG